MSVAAILAGLIFGFLLFGAIGVSLHIMRVMEHGPQPVKPGGAKAWVGLTICMALGVLMVKACT